MTPSNERGRLWDPAAQVNRASLPSTGSRIAGLSAGFDGADQDAIPEERQRQALY